MEQQFQFDIEVNPDPRDIESLRDHVDTFNVEETKIYDYRDLAIFLRDSMGQLIAESVRIHGVGASTFDSCGCARTFVERDLDQS